MATHKTIRLRIGRTYDVTSVVSGIDDWTNKNAVLYVARDYGGDSMLTKIGSIATNANTVSFSLTTADTKALSGKYKYEITIYKDDGSFVKDTNYGTIDMIPVVDKDPTS